MRTLPLVGLVLSCGCVVAAEHDVLQDWLRSSLLEPSPPATAPSVGIQVLRQDHGTFHLNRSVIDTAPMQIGAKSFAHGLGTHSISHIVVNLPSPAKSFESSIGIDNNYDTQGKHGTVVFVVEVGGKELYRSGICRGGEQPVPVKLDLPGVRQLTLRVLDAGDGPGWDQADWCDAAVTYADGTRKRLDELPVVGGLQTPGLVSDKPFSFIYGGKTSAEILRACKLSFVSNDGPGFRQHTITWTDAASGLEIICELKTFADLPAAEWVLRFRNAGQQDTPILENVLALDMRMVLPTGETILHHANGSTCARAISCRWTRSSRPRRTSISRRTAADRPTGICRSSTCTTPAGGWRAPLAGPASGP